MLELAPPSFHLLGEIIRGSIVLPLVMILPGYLLLRLFPLSPFGWLERLAFSILLSMALLIVGGVALNWTPWGLSTRSWVVYLSILIAAMGLTSLHRGRRAARPRPPIRALQTRSDTGIFAARQSLLIGLAFIVALAAVAVAVFGASLGSTPGFTQLWLLPEDSASAGPFHVGVRNEENKSMIYRLVITADGRVVAEWSTIVLGQGEDWTMTVTLAAGDLSAAKIQADLFRSDDPNTVYRQAFVRR